MVSELNVADLVLLVGASFAIVHYLVYERGLFDVLHRLRYTVGINGLYDMERGVLVERSGYVPSKILAQNNLMFVSNGNTLAEILSCHRCTTFWVTLFVTFIYYVAMSPNLASLAVIWLGLCGSTVFLLEIANK